MHIRKTWDTYHEGAGWVGMTVAGGIDSEGDITPITYVSSLYSKLRLINVIGTVSVKIPEDSLSRTIFWRVSDGMKRTGIWP